MTLPIELKWVFWKLDHSYSESHFSFLHSFSRWSVTWSLAVICELFLRFYVGEMAEEKDICYLWKSCFCIFHFLGYLISKTGWSIMSHGISVSLCLSTSHKYRVSFFLLPFVICSPGFYISFQCWHSIHWKVDSLDSPWSSTLPMCYEA